MVLISQVSPPSPVEKTLHGCAVDNEVRLLQSVRPVRATTPPTVALPRAGRPARPAQGPANQASLAPPPCTGVDFPMARLYSVQNAVREAGHDRDCSQDR